MAVTRLSLRLLVPVDLPASDCAAILRALDPLMHARGGSVELWHENSGYEGSESLMLAIVPHKAEGGVSSVSWRGPEQQGDLLADRVGA